MTEQLEKRCTKCKEMKPMEDYSKNSSNKDGKQVRCRICFAAYLRDYRAEKQRRMKEKYKGYGLDE